MLCKRRVFDSCIALALLVALSSVIVLSAVLILLVDRQNPIFGAQRVKAQGCDFTMWKLRTMRGSDDGLPSGGPKSTNVTRLGRVLRRWHIDELPQLWNVLRGDMAFIGLRPPTRRAVLRHVNIFSELFQHPPGLTGLATVTMGREERQALASLSTMAELEHVYMTKILPCKLKVELEYQRRWSPGLDLWICLKTIRVILFHAPPGHKDLCLNWVGNEAGLRPLP